jgi:hypothetical protein
MEVFVSTSWVPQIFYAGLTSEADFLSIPGHCKAAVSRSVINEIPLIDYEDWPIRLRMMDTCLLLTLQDKLTKYWHYRNISLV